MDLKPVLIGSKSMAMVMRMPSFPTSNLSLASNNVSFYKGTSRDVACFSSSKYGITMAGQEKYGVEPYSFGYDDGSYLLTVLDSLDDDYGGVIVNPEKLPFDATVFASILCSSIEIWKTKGKKGIWLKLPLEKCEFVPIAVKEGFRYHHAESEYVMMTYWIPNEPCMLPANASHQVGVGGFVVNEKNEVLVVQEKHCAPELIGLWKLPTGFISESEEIFTGAVREVKEETGIDTEFLEVIAFRHAHNVAFEKSDLFFICMLRPLSYEIKIDDLEIHSAKWMTLTEFVEQPLVQGDNMFKKMIDACIARIGKRYCGLSVHKVVSKFDNGLSSLYYNVVDDQRLDCSTDSCLSSYTS